MRVGSGRRASASQKLPEALSRAERPVKGDGYRRRSKPLTGRHAPPTLQSVMATAAPSWSTMPALSAMSQRSTTADAIPARAASTPDPSHRDAWRGGKHLPVSCDTPFKHLINMN